MSYLGKDFVKRRDPRVKKPASKAAAGPDVKSEFESDSQLANESAGRSVRQQSAQAAKTESSSAAEAGPSQNPRFIGAEKRRVVFQRDDSCRWKCKHTGQTCGSKFQGEVDHIVPVWAGGTNELENLQVLCSVHNQEKYKRESGRSKTRQAEFDIH